MKQKFRLFKTLLFCGLLALSSCQDDSADRLNETSQNHSKHAYLDFEMFSKLYPESASRVKSQNEKSKEQLQRGIYDPENDFTIDTDRIFMAENEGGTYLTFSVSKGVENTQGLDNLVLKLDLEDKVTPMLVHYNLTEQEKANLIEGEPISDLDQKVSFELLDGVILNSVGDTSKMECSSFMIAYCSGTMGHPNGMEEDGTRCPGYTEEVITTCSGGASSGGGGPAWGDIPSPSTPNTGNSPGQSGGGGGNPGTGTYNPNGPSIPVITTPLPGEEVEVQIVDPCVKLKEKAINLVFNNKVGQLKSPNVYALDHEKGFVETLSPYKKSIYINVEGTAMSNNISIPRSMNAIGIVHVHNNDYVNQQGTLVNTIKILSPKDVLSLINFQNNAIAQGVSYSDAYVEMLSSEGHFVIRLLEPVDSNFFTNLQFIKFNIEYNNKAVKMIEDGNFNSENLQKMLLGFLKEYGLENKVALYIATNDAVTQWSRLTLNPQNPNNLPIKTPCN